MSPMDCALKLDYSALARQVAGLRKHFQGCVFACRNGVTWMYNMLVLVVMQPFFMAWLPLKCLSDSQTTSDETETANVCELFGSWCLQFSFELGDITYSDVLEHVSLRDAYYLTGLSWKGACMLETVDCMHALGDAFHGISLAQAPEKAQRTQTRQVSASACGSSDTTPAWMRMLDTFGTEHKNRSQSVDGGVAKPPHATGADASHGGAADLEDTCVTWQEIESLRQGAEDDSPAFEEHFRESLLGGAWQQERTGRDTYGYQSVAKRNSVVALCARRFGLSSSAAFETNVYNEHGCTLSLLWRMRMYELARHWDENGRPELFPLGSLNEFTPPEHLLKPLQDANSRVKKRLQAILRLSPDASMCAKNACI
eukprot:6492283-Amphidinium_carterae.4